ncbi:MAG: DUF721 domain-containing protein, partial [Pseudomonadota bacterium]|nr:DUF721 domain-containing protein [Pseudomonadota bacterium]
QMNVNIMNDRRKYSFFPKTLSSCVEPLVRPVMRAKGLAGSRILTEWESIVGRELARHTLPEKIAFPQGKKTGGTLTIAVENGFALELQHMQPKILERVAGYFGYAAISRINISPAVLPVAAPLKTRPPRQRLAPGSARLADNVEDGALKEALQSLARTLEGKSAKGRADDR